MQKSKLELDREYMRLALDAARRTLEEGNYPVGAALIVDGQVRGVAGNLKNVQRDHISHAELQLFQQFSKEIYAKKDSKVEIYCNLEPCLMCYGAAVLHRSARVVFACLDPQQKQIRQIAEQAIGAYYIDHPTVEQIGDPRLVSESKDLFVEYFSTRVDAIGKKSLKLFRDL